ncbi:MAG: flagellin [Methanoregula sp. PtaU1.Bin006]|nr:MAG: flagellin [Methanoregula sp. PtaU1.Bin006]
MRRMTADIFTSPQKRPVDEAFTGLEAAIVLIAFVVVAAVFSYVVLGAGFYTTQKTQESVYKSVEQATSNIQMSGQVYGVDSGATGTVNTVQFGIGLAPGAPPVDLTKMIIVVTQPDNNNQVQFLTYSSQATAGSKFGIGATSLHDQEQETILIKLGTGLGPNQRITVEIRPPVGSALLFTRAAPATIKYTQVLT